MTLEEFGDLQLEDLRQREAASAAAASSGVSSGPRRYFLLSLSIYRAVK